MAKAPKISKKMMAAMEKQEGESPMMHKGKGKSSKTKSKKSNKK